MTGKIENKAENMVNDMGNSSDIDKDSDYTAERTDTTLGMNNNNWTWIIIGVAAIAIVAIIWYYLVQISNTKVTNSRDTKNTRDDHFDDDFKE